MPSFDLGGKPERFVVGIMERHDLNRAAGFLLCPQGLAKPVGVLGDHGVGSIEDVPG